MKLKIGLAGWIFAVMVLSAGTCFAAHPLISDDAGVLGKGTIQGELNGDISYDKETVNGSTTKTNGDQLAATIGVGASDTLDLVFGLTRPWGSGRADGVSFNDAGSTDFALTMKWQVLLHEGFSIAVKPQFGYSYAVGQKDDHTMSYGAGLVLSKEFERLALHLNAGYVYNDYNRADVRDACRESIGSFSLAATYKILEHMKLVADIGASTSADKSSNEMPVFGLVGFIYGVNINLDLSAGLKVGLTRPEDDLTGTFGITLKY